MEPGDAQAQLTSPGGWRSALRDWRDNPLYLRLKLARRRQESRMNKAGRYAPLIIALLPAAVSVAGWLLSGIIWTQYDMERVVKGTVTAYAITACVIWFAQGFHAMVLDCMLLLNRSARRQVNTTIDDLAAVSALSSQEIAVGSLAAVLPALWLRIFVCAACAMGVYLIYSADFFGNAGIFDSFSEEQLVAMAFALPTVGIVALGGMLASVALSLYLISLSENYSFSLASATAVLYTMGALAWVPVSVVLMIFTSEMAGVSLFGVGDPSTAWASAQFLSPLAYVMLVWLGLIIARDQPWLRPVYALGSPWLNPVLLFIVGGMFIVVTGFWDSGESLGVMLMVMLYQFGTFAPLSLTYLPTLALLGLEYTDWEGVLLQLGAYVVHLATLALLIVICARHAVSAIERRRQSPVS